MALLVHGQVLAPRTLYRHVGIPLYISDVRVFRQQVVDNLEDIFLHFRITHIEDQLSAATAGADGAFRSFYHPFRMFLIEFTGRIRRLRLYPDAEFDVVLLGVLHKIAKSVWQLLLVDNPVAEGSIVGVAFVFIAKPAIVHHEELTAHVGNVAHHLVHVLLVDIEVDTLPRVEEYPAELIAMCETVLTTPFVEVARCTRQALLGESQCQYRRSECLAFLQLVETVLRVYTGDKAVILRVVGDDFQLVVSAIAESGSDNVTAVLLSLAIQGEHHLGV